MSKTNWSLLGILCLAAAAGCGSNLPPAADPDQARTALKTALEAWQKGDKAETLLVQSPAIQCTDEDWNKGWSLKSYKLAAKDEPFGLQRRIVAQLSLRSPEGKNMDKDVHYEIDTAPAIVIVRAFE